MGMAIETREWTLEDLHRLPDDGNKYELVRGELFVTPAPAVSHEMVLARLDMLLWPYVAAQKLGIIFRPRAVVQFEGSEVEPDLMVRPKPDENSAWKDVPTPILGVEVASRTTHRRDRNQKKQLYLDAGVAEYWIVDRQERSVTVVRPGKRDVHVSDAIEWHPVATSALLTIPLADVFGTP
jgi:Uma2 family endonuclease